MYCTRISRWGRHLRILPSAMRTSDREHFVEPVRVYDVYDVGVRTLLWFCGMGAASASLWRPTGLVSIPVSTGVGAVCGLVVGSVCAAPIAYLIHRKRWGAASSIVFYPASLLTLAVSYWGPWMPWSGAGVCAASVLGFSVITKFALEDRPICRDWMCGICRYDLRGSPEGVCPECGGSRESAVSADNAA